MDNISDEKELEENFFDSIAIDKTENSRDSWKVHLRLDHIPTTFKPDAGTVVILISEGLYKKSRPQVIGKRYKNFWAWTI